VGDAQGWRKQAVSDAIRHAISSSLMKFVAKQLSIVSAVQPQWSLPEGLMAEVLAVAPAPPIPLDPDLDAMEGLEGVPRVTPEVAPAPAPARTDPFGLLLGPVPAPFRIHRPTPAADADGLPGGPVSTAEAAPEDVPTGTQGLLPAGLLEMAPEFRASRTRVGLVVSVRPAFEAVASRTRSHR
jgi:hypothetical protein